MTEFTPSVMDVSGFSETTGDRIETKMVTEQDVKTIKLQERGSAYSFRIGQRRDTG